MKKLLLTTALIVGGTSAFANAGYVQDLHDKALVAAPMITHFNCDAFIDANGATCAALNDQITELKAEIDALTHADFDIHPLYAAWDQDRETALRELSAAYDARNNQGLIDAITEAQREARAHGGEALDIMSNAADKALNAFEALEAFEAAIEAQDYAAFADLAAAFNTALEELQEATPYYINRDTFKAQAEDLISGVQAIAASVDNDGPWNDYARPHLEWWNPGFNDKVYRYTALADKWHALDDALDETRETYLIPGGVIRGAWFDLHEVNARPVITFNADTRIPFKNFGLALDAVEDVMTSWLREEQTQYLNQVESAEAVNTYIASLTDAQVRIRDDINGIYRSIEVLASDYTTSFNAAIQAFSAYNAVADTYADVATDEVALGVIVADTIDNLETVVTGLQDGWDQRFKNDELYNTGAIQAAEWREENANIAAAEAEYLAALPEAETAGIPVNSIVLNINESLEVIRASGVDYHSTELQNEMTRWNPSSADSFAAYNEVPSTDDIVALYVAYVDAYTGMNWDASELPAPSL